MLHACTLLAALLAAPSPASVVGPKRDVQRRANLLSRLVENGDSAAVAFTLAELERGLPPAIIESFLVAAAEHPHPDFVPAIRRLLDYRNPSIRVRAVLALAEHPQRGAEAAMRAMNDSDPRLRQLGLMLVERFTNPALEEAAIRLRARESSLVE